MAELDLVLQNRVIGSIHIRPYVEDDADAICEAVLESKAELSSWLPWCHGQYSIEDSRSWISARLKAFPAGVDYAFGIFDEANRLLGRVWSEQDFTRGAYGESGVLGAEFGHLPRGRVLRDTIVSRFGIREHSARLTGNSCLDARRPEPTSSPRGGRDSGRSSKEQNRSEQQIA